MLDKYEELIEFVNEKRYCFCYGAGTYGQRLVKYCKKHEIKITAFVVSDDQKNKNPKSMLSLPVYTLSDLLNIEEGNIIIAIDGQHHNIVLAQLRKYGCESNVAVLEKAPTFLMDDYESEVLTRKAVSFFDYKRLAEDMDLVTNEKYFNNAFYGNDRIVKKILRKSAREVLDASIEHGVPGGNALLKEDVQFGNIYYVANKYRANLFQKYLPNKKVESIGLYMQYIEELLSPEEHEIIKKKIGRTLLVFPYHSTHHIETKFNEFDLIMEIESIKEKFDTVLICMYWNDILLKKDQPYKDKKYQIVTAGHIFDYHFLARLKSIIKLADITMSNGVGGHIGYCVYLDKPHYLFLQKFNYFQNGKVIVNAEKFGVIDANCYITRYDAEFQTNLEKEALIHFGKYKEFLTEDDIRFVQEYWGEWK